MTPRSMNGARADRHACFAVTAPGLEAVAAAELASIGLEGAAEDGGIAFEATAAGLYAANLRLRTVSRVLVRVAEFRARTFYELERHTRRIEWDRFVAPGRPVRLRVTSRKSKLYHEGAVAERLLEAMERRVGSLATSPPDSGGRSPALESAGSAAPAPELEAEGDDGAGAQLFVIRFLRDRCTISADSSGALLHVRGYRQAVAKAPLRETLAAAMLLRTARDPRAPLLDPFCGSGTIPIEAALIARRIAPGLASPEAAPRAFAFQDWPTFEAAEWAAVVGAARQESRPSASAPILGSDRDAGAIAAARDNAVRAGVAEDLDLDVLPLSAIRPQAGPGWLVTNPPYGVRVGRPDTLRDLYATLGRIARERLPGWTVALLSADPRLHGHARLPLEEALRTRNGGIPVRLLVGRVPSGRSGG